MDRKERHAVVARSKRREVNMLFGGSSNLLSAAMLARLRAVLGSGVVGQADAEPWNSLATPD